MTDTTDPRIAVLSAMAYPPYNEIAEARCTTWAEAERMLDAYRDAVLAEPPVDRADDGPVDDMRELYAVQHAIRDAGGELTRDVHKAIDALREVWDREVRRLQGLRRMADEAHACPNCEGIDPDTCLMNPARNREAQPAGPATDDEARP